MGEIALELERIGFRTPTVYQSAWTPARDRLGTGSKKSGAGIPLCETPRSGRPAASSANTLLPEELSVLTPHDKVHSYLGKWQFWQKLLMEMPPVPVLHRGCEYCK
jgi:hypothetical protein